MVSGLLRHVVWYMDVNVSEDCGASFFRVEVRGASESELLYNWLSVSQSWSRVLFGTHNRMLIFCQTIKDLVILGRPFWREDGSICVLAFSVVTIQKIKLFITCKICNIYNTYSSQKATVGPGLAEQITPHSVL